jgi:hypothetical protein
MEQYPIRDEPRRILTHRELFISSYFPRFIIRNIQIPKINPLKNN